MCGPQFIVQAIFRFSVHQCLSGIVIPCTLTIKKGHGWCVNTNQTFFLVCFAALTSPTPDGPNVAAQTGGALKNKTLWIVIAAVAGITLIAIIIISVILCKKRSGDDIQR